MTAGDSLPSRVGGRGAGIIGNRVMPAAVGRRMEWECETC